MTDVFHHTPECHLTAVEHLQLVAGIQQFHQADDLCRPADGGSPSVVGRPAGAMAEPDL
ncbi:hypothetical protein OXV57_05310 [Bacteroides fragilis]|nr:hypothetical protein [Bacteroides fragilis]